MIDVPAAFSLLLANAVIVLGGLAFFRLRDRTTSSGSDVACRICSRTVADGLPDAEYPVCQRCESEYMEKA